MPNRVAVESLCLASLNRTRMTWPHDRTLRMVLDPISAALKGEKIGKLSSQHSGMGRVFRNVPVCEHLWIGTERCVKLAGPPPSPSTQHHRLGVPMTVDDIAPAATACSRSHCAFSYGSSPSAAKLHSPCRQALVFGWVGDFVHTVDLLLDRTGSLCVLFFAENFIFLGFVYF